MAYDPLTAAELQVGKPVSETLLNKIKGNFEYLFGTIDSLGSVDIPNGSAEVDSDADGTPDSWTFTPYAGGSGTRDTANAAHGAACFAATHPGGAGNGGGYFESDYVACSPQMLEVLSLVHWATAAGMHNKIDVRFFDASKVYQSTQTVYDSTAAPTAATRILAGFTPPAGCTFFKVQLHGGVDDVDVAGTAFFDGVTRLTSHDKLTYSTPAFPGILASNASTLVDRASVAIGRTCSNLPVILTISAYMRAGNSTYTASQRFRVGGTYSATGTTNSTSDVSKTYTISLPAGVGDITLTMQLAAQHSSYWTVGSTPSLPTLTMS